MNTPTRSRAVLVLAVVALFATPAAALSFSGQTAPPAQENATNESVQPGAQMASVVGVSDAEVNGAVEGRAFGQAVASARSNESKAAVVEAHVQRLESRLADLQQRRTNLTMAAENGTMNQQAYRARTAALAAQIQQVERQLNHSQRTAMALPPQARNAAGLNVTTIETLRSQAGDLRGGEMARIARGMAGRGVGHGIPDVPRGGPPEGVPGNWTHGPGMGGPPGDTGQPGDRGPGSDRGTGTDRDREPGSDRGPGQRGNMTSNR